MGMPPRDRLARLLAGEDATSADSAELRLPTDALQLQVADIGDIALPIRGPQAKRLISVARPAQFGRGEETLHDAAVRDTWLITPDQVTLAGARWQEHLATALDGFRDALGLPAGSELRAELHSLLVYGKGQFFLPHQDSEKHTDMVATLVVALPSVHSGGDLVVDDRGRERIYRGSRDDLVLIAFYADRRHEVRPVRSGYRVTMTFNILLDAPSTPTEAELVAQAAHLLDEHLTTRITSRYGMRDLGTPTRLAFLLDHEYSQRGLAARRFKGADTERVAVLGAAAERADCEYVLALAEVKETRDALPVGNASYYGGYDGFEDDDSEDPDSYETGDLIDDEIALGWWVNPDGSDAEPINLGLDDNEVCTVTPTTSLTPYESEYEGYMGNYGNTVDRWYRRAAVVIWPKERAFAARAEASALWALRTLQDGIAAGELDGARADAASLEPFWLRVEARALTSALGVATGLRDPETASVVLAPFRLEMLNAEHATALATVVQEYGEPWWEDILGRWDSTHRYPGHDLNVWVGESLLPLCRTLNAQGAGRVADQLVDRAWQWLSGSLDLWVRHQHPAQRQTQLAGLGPLAARLLEAASDERGKAIVEALRSFDDNVVALLVPALRSHQPPAPAAATALAEDCRERLVRIIARPERADDDWSIRWSGCGCADCDQLAAFLNSSTDHTEIWPLAQARRRHIHSGIDAAGLPVRHTTRRQGRPYSLILTKTEDLFRTEKEERRQAASDLAWLRSVFS